ncbi:MAG: hypothetical protein Q9201_002907 [Fulgogasparrea decipioides]
MNASSTWKVNGFWQLGNERNLGIYANGLFGNDTLGLGIQGSGGPTLTDQVIATIGTQDIYVGMFAVNPKRTNFTGITDGQASHMTALKQQNLIPSVSFGYTAGAPYRLKKMLGSLTLGGYDQARFTPNNMSFSFAPDNDRDIVVGIQSIVSIDQDGMTHDLLPTGVNAYVDSTVPQIWLPIEACRAFEKAFDLIYDTENQVYPVSNTLHSKLLTQNASITFTLGNSNSGGQTIDITLPYDSFDLQAQPPFTSNATRYFPLQRAVNDTQYTLGRTFLQEAYLTVDWERSNFSISQCLFDPDNLQEKLIPIKSVNATTTGQDSTTSTRKTIGIAVGIVAVVVLVVCGMATFFVLRRRKRRQQAEMTKPNGEDDEAEKIRQGFAKAELDTDHDHARYEMGGLDDSPGITLANGTAEEKANLHAELMGDRSMAELNGNGTSELSAHKGTSGPYHEMYDPSTSPVELPANLPTELPASPLPSFSRSSRSSSQVFGSANMSDSAASRQPPGGRGPASRRLAQSSQSSASRIASARSQSSAPSTSGQASGGPSSSQWSGAPSMREHEPFSPISPIGGSEDGSGHEGLFSIVRGIAEPTRPQEHRAQSSGGKERFHDYRGNNV